MPEIKKYLNRDGLEDYNSLLPHSAGEMQAYVDAWLDDHPEATTTVQDGSVTAQKLAAKSVTRAKLADDVTHLLGGMMLTKETQGEPIIVNDAWSIEPITLTIDGKSTQAETPTPDNPIPIVSLEILAINVHASADGTVDYANWPVSVPIGQYVLKSLPNGTCDAMKLTYLNPSTRDGWALYAREAVQAISTVTLDGSETWKRALAAPRRMYTDSNATNSKFSDIAIAGSDQNPNNVTVLCDHFVYGGSYSRPSQQYAVTVGGASNYTSLCFDWRNIATDMTVADWKSWLNENPIIIQYPLATSITTQLDPVELPVLPAPNCTIWSDPTTGLKMTYMRNSNIVISDIEQAIADL